MPALVTQTIDSKPRILLITEPSQLSKLVAEELNLSQIAELEVISYQKFTAKKNQLLAQEWYRICLLVEHHVDEKSKPKLPSALPAQALVLMPLTTAVSTKHDLSQQWLAQVQAEINIFNKYVKYIGVSGFIFYKDLVKKATYPTQFFFNQLEREWLLDPDLELALTTTPALAPKLAALLLQPQRQTRLIEGKKRRSRAFLTQLQNLYAQYYQLKPLIKQVVLKEQSHPVLSLAPEGLISEQAASLADEISTEIMRSLMVGNQAGGDEAKDQVEEKKAIAPPDKKELIKAWNKMKQGSQDLLQVAVGVRPKAIKSAHGSDFKPEVNSLFNAYRQQQKQTHLKELTTQTRKGFRKLKHHRLFFFGGLGVTLMAVGVIIFISRLLFNAGKINQQLLTYIQSSSLPTTAQDKRLVDLKSSADKVGVQLRWLNGIFSASLFPQIDRKVELSQQVVDLVEQQKTFEQLSTHIYQQLMSVSSESTESDFMVGLQDLDGRAAQIYKTLSLLQAELKNYSLDELGEAEKESFIQFQQRVVDQEKKVDQFRRLSPILPQLLGQDGKKVYAVLLQNNQELRPTGGFLQAVALLTFDQGKLINTQVEDVYALDQQLKPILAPPADLKQFLGEERWFLRDGNWNPDFPQTAERVSWFLDQSLGVKVDGVIGINLKVIESLLTSLDQLDLAEYNEVLTTRNLAERMEFHSEVQLLDSSQKPDYSELVLLTLLRKMENLSAEKVHPTLSALAASAEAKEMSVAVFNQENQRVFESLGWSGSLVEPECPAVLSEADCFVDAIAQVEANVGVNKANYYLDRQIDHSILLQTNKAVHKRLITYKNEAQTNAWPKGPYQAYTRFYLPLNVEKVEIKVNDQVVPEDHLILQQELGRRVVGVLTETLVKEKTQLELNYTVTYAQSTPFSYAFFDQKQPGAREVSPRVFLRHQPDLSPTLIAPQAEVQGDVIVFNPSQDTGHMFVGAAFD